MHEGDTVAEITRWMCPRDLGCVLCMTLIRNSILGSRLLAVCTESRSKRTEAGLAFGQDCSRPPRTAGGSPWRTHSGFGFA